jgi:hypothetical protein
VRPEVTETFGPETIYVAKVVNLGNEVAMCGIKTLACVCALYVHVEITDWLIQAKSGIDGSQRASSGAGKVPGAFAKRDLIITKKAAPSDYDR